MGAAVEGPVLATRRVFKQMWRAKDLIFYRLNERGTQSPHIRLQLSFPRRFPFIHGKFRFSIPTISYPEISALLNYYPLSIISPVCVNRVLISFSIALLPRPIIYNRKREPYAWGFIYFFLTKNDNSKSKSTAYIMIRFVFKFARSIINLKNSVMSGGHNANR